MRRYAAGLLLLLAPTVLAGCSPARTAVVGIGLNDAGELIAAVAPCDAEDLTLAYLSTYEEEPAVVGEWERSSPLRETENWTLQVHSDSPWRPIGAGLTTLSDVERYEFGLASEDSGEQSNWVTFTGADLRPLSAGQILVQRYGPVDSGGDQEVSLAVINLDDLAGEHCGYY